MYLLTFLGAYLQKWPGPVTSLRVELIMPSHYLFIIFHHKDTSHKRKHKKTRLITICNRKFTFLCRCYCVYFVILRPSFVFFFFLISMDFAFRVWESHLMIMNCFICQRIWPKGYCQHLILQLVILFVYYFFETLRKKLTNIICRTVALHFWKFLNTKMCSVMHFITVFSSDNQRFTWMIMQ